MLFTNDDHLPIKYEPEKKTQISSDKSKRLAERLCAFYVHHPKVAFALTLSFQLSLLLVTAVLYLANYNIFPYDFTQVPLNLEHDATKLSADAFNFVTDDPRIDLLPTVAIPQPERTIKTSPPLELIYKSDQGNVLTSQNLKEIAKFENELMEIPEYQTICLRDSRTNKCALPQSIVRLFDGSIKFANTSLYDPNFENIDYIFNIANNISEFKPLISFALDQKHSIEPGRVYSKHVRSIMFNGLPLKGFENGQDRKKEQNEIIKRNMVNGFSVFLNNKYKSGLGDLKFYYMNLDLFFHAVDKQVIWDLLLALGSLLFIFCFIWFQTGSLWITGWAIFGIVTNFFGANLVYRIILDFRFIGIFHVLSVFMILGIGADDVFVFFNTWKLMETRKFDNLVDHLTATFKSASGAMFVTSFTTAAAFFASAASPLLGVSSFGVFSGILVIVNYVSIIVYFPSVVVTYHFYWKKSASCCNPQKNLKEYKENAPEDNMTRLFKLVVDWLETSYANNIVMHRKIRWLVLAVFLGFSIMCCVFATKLGPDEDQVQVWPKGTNWYDIRQIKLKDFTETGEGLNVIRVYIVWGLKLQDRSNCHFTDFKCKGNTVFDDYFDMNDERCQESMLTFCRNLKSLTPEESDKLKIRRSVATKQLEVSCYIDEMQKYLQDETINIYDKYKQSPVTYNLTLPLNPTSVRNLMLAYPHIYNVSILSNEYRHYFEVALGYWLSAGGNPEKKFDYYKYASYMGGTLDKSGTVHDGIISKSQGGKYGNRLRYVAIVVNTSLTGAILKYNLGRQVYHNWEEYIKQETKKMPRTCSQAFQCTPEWNNWHWLKVQGELLIGARNGIIIGLSVAFPVIVLTTFNWIIGILATLTVGLITLSVVGLIPLLGWSLGVMESINLTLVVGLAVDYAVHLADGYVRSAKYTRQERVRYMLGHVGISVLAGASTTLGASAFMLGSNLLFFLQFGIFMFCTIGFSIIYALAFFTVLVSIVGPEGDSGNLWNIMKYFKINAKKREDVVLICDNSDNSKEENGFPELLESVSESTI